MNEELAVIKYDTVMLKALPSKVALVNQKVHLGLYLENLLSLHGEVSTKRLAVLLSFVEILVGELSLKDVKEAFMMHVEGKLPTEPRTNYLDTVLFSKVIKEYKNQRRVKKTIKEPEMTQEEKDNNIYLGCITCFDSYIQTDKIIYGYTWVYDHLDDLKLLKFTDDEKRKIMPIAKSKLIEENKQIYSHSEFQSFIRDLENKKKEQSIINMAKRMMLIRFFSHIHAQEKHIRNLL